MDRYIRQIYGGNPPSMDYYRQLGQQKSMNTFAQKEAERLRKEAEKNRKKQEKEEEKKKADDALEALMNQLRPQQQQTAPTAAPPKAPKQPGKLRRSLDDVVEGAKAFGQAINPFDDVSMNQAFENYTNRERPDEAKNVARGMSRTVDSMSFGAMGAMDKKISGGVDPSYREARAFGDGGGADMIYDLVGSLVPGAGIAGALRGVGMGANMTRGMTAAQKAAQRAKEGMAAGALYGGTEAAVNEALDPNRRTAMEHMQNIGLETLFGGVADPALGGLGDLIGKGLRGRNVTFPPQAEQLALPEPQLALPPPQQALPAPQPARSPVTPPQRTPEVRNVLSDPIVPDVELGRSYRSPGNYTPQLDISTKIDGPINAPEVKQQRASELTAQKQQLEQQLTRTKDEFIDDILDSYGVDRTPEEQIIKADMDWEQVKKDRQAYKELTARTEKFTIPEELAEEYKHIIPRTFIDKNSSVDIYKAAELAGYSGDPQGVDEFARELRRLQESTSKRKMDVTPDVDQKALDEIAKAREMAEMLFQESDEFQSLKPILDALEEDLLSLNQSKPNVNVNVTGKQSSNPLDILSTLGPNQQPTPTAPTAPKGPEPKYTKTMYQGRGKGADEIYSGVQYPIAGEGQYYAFTDADAKLYGDNVSSVDIELYNPLTIRNDDEWRALVKGEVGWEFPNITGIPEERAKKQIDALKQHLLDNGYDGLVIEMDKRGDASRTLKKVFGHDQAVVYEDAPIRSKNTATGNPPSAPTAPPVPNTPNTPKGPVTPPGNGPNGPSTPPTGPNGPNKPPGGNTPPPSGPTPPGGNTPPPNSPSPPGNIKDIDYGNRSLDKPETIMGKFNQFLEKFSDKGRAIKVVERDIQRAVGNLNKKYKNAYRDWRLVPGATGAGEHYLTQNLLKPMQDLQSKGLDLREGWDYLVNMQLKRVKELNPKYVLPGEGNTKARVDGIVNQLGQNQMNKEFADVVRKTQRDMLEMLRQNGVISKKQMDAMIKQYPDYVPLFRQKGVQTTDEFLNQYTTGNVRKAIFEMKDGSEDMIADPLGNFTDYIMNAHQAAFTNKALQHVTSLDGIKIDGKPLATDVTADPSKGNQKLQVRFKQNGKEKVYELTPDLYMAYNNLKSVMHPNPIFRFFEGMGKVQRQSITANPIFTVKQLFRDIPEAYYNGRFSLVKDLLPATLDLISGGKLKGSMLDDFYKHGAGYGNIVSMDRASNHALKRAALKMKPDKNIKDIAESAYEETLGRVFNGLRSFNETLENVPRMAQFRATARRTKGDLDQAAFEARDLMDFSMTGSATQHVNRVVAFVNANIRGKERFARSLKERPVETMLKAVIVNGGMSTVAYMAYDKLASPKQKEIMESLPEWQRQTHWFFPDMLNESNLVRIPKPYEASIVTSTPLEFALWNEHLVGSDIKDYLVNWATESFLIDASLNPVTPLFELKADKDTFKNSSISSSRETHLERGQQGDVYTPFLAEKLGKVTGANPRHIEHLMKGYMPTTSENINVVVDRIAELTGARENQRPAGTAGGVDRMFNPFTMSGENFQTDRIGDIYQAADDAQGLKKRTQQEEGDLFQYPNAYKAINQLKSQDQDMASMIRDIDNDPNLDRYEKKRLREEIIAQRNEFANRQVTSGRTEVNDDNLAALEQEFEGLGASTTKTDVKAVLSTRLQQRGIPKHIINQVMSMDLTDEQLAEAVRKLLQAS